MLTASLLTATILTATTAAPVHLVSLRSQPEPDPSWEEGGDTASPEETAPAEDLETDSGFTDDDDEPPADPLTTANGESAPEAPATTSTPTDPGELPIPSKRGVGLMATAGALGGLAWAVLGVRIYNIKQACKGSNVDLESVSEDDLASLTDSAADCVVQGRGRNAGLWFLQALPNSANWGLAPAAAMYRAKYDAARSVKTGEVDRNPAVFIGTGAALLGAGAIGRVVVAAIRIRSLNPANGVAANCVEDGQTQVDDFFNCYANRNALLYGMHQLSSSAIAGGAGLLTYGLVYKRERRNYEKVYGAKKTAALEFTVQPQLSLDYSGVSANLRF